MKGELTKSNFLETQVNPVYIISAYNHSIILIGVNMKKFILCSLLLVFISSYSVQAQDQAQMQQWQEYMTPGPMHKILANNVGQWKGEITLWMDPSQPPTKLESTAICESLFDGKYFQTKYSGEMMGMPYNGLEITGFDNAKKKFFSSLIDNMGTGIMTLEGTYDEATKTITFIGSETDFSGKDMKVRETMKSIDNDNMLFEMFMDQGAGEMKSMEVKYTRIKS